MNTLLFVDDDDTYRVVLTRELSRSGYSVSAFRDAESALRGLDGLQPDVALVDLRLPGMDGIELLARLLERVPGLPVVMNTGHGAVPDAVHAMRQGAFDFLTKPASLDIVEQCLARATRHRELTLENERLRELIQRKDGGTEILGQSPAIADLRALVSRIAKSDASVLILGENGTGKELVAQRLHEESPRHDHPFVVINSGAMTRRANGRMVAPT